ncbi:conserved hypothetical protein [Burkholderia diffusa]|uniref:hypothetical protein n=1 Tax=Burkholderia diffusa TaxID=488732 RepID=UPI001CAD6512|nr:hypothetical protein [Burkholderia diffusa]CAG9259208.1 conserved hypothetical protein [Burkholderia diffusa]
MDTKQLVLKLALEEAGQSLDVDTLDDRMRLQKAVYLLQAAGANLGYRYSWYLKGPYSTALTQDYFAIAEAVRDGDAADGRSLKDEVAQRLKVAAKILVRPQQAKEIPIPQWYELLASLHYLKTSEGYTGAALKRVLSTRKSHLAEYADLGIEHLKNFDLL